MAIRIAPFEAAHSPAVQRLNARLRAGGCRYRFPESPVPEWLPPAHGERLYQEYFLAVDDAEVRGGYILKHQDFVVRGQTSSIGNFQLPLSEGVIDARYAAVAIQLLSDALRRQPLLYALGLGSRDVPVARLLVAAGWHMHTVPFYFRVCNARRFLRRMQYVRKGALRRLALDLLALTGVGPLGIHLWQKVRTRRRFTIASGPIERFDLEFDHVWNETSSAFSLAAVRDSATLARLYDRSSRFIKIRIGDSKPMQGWAVMLATSLVDDRYFGSLRVGTIVDALCRPGFESALMSACIDSLRQSGADLIISNQSYAPLCRGLADCGFLSGPSNFFLATSPALTARLAPVEQHLPTAHFTRGDGDGPIHL